MDKTTDILKAGATMLGSALLTVIAYKVANMLLDTATEALDKSGAIDKIKDSSSALAARIVSK